jgi:hypothetical protein
MLCVVVDTAVRVVGGSVMVTGSPAIVTVIVGPNEQVYSDGGDELVGQADGLAVMVVVDVDVSVCGAGHEEVDADSGTVELGVIPEGAVALQDCWINVTVTVFVTLGDDDGHPTLTLVVGDIDEVLSDVTEADLDEVAVGEEEVLEGADDVDKTL